MSPHPDPHMCAALAQMATPLSPQPPWQPERLVAPPREHKPDPPCSEGGPHRYPLGPGAVCSMCGIGPAANAIAGLGRIEADAKIREAFA